MAGNLQFREKMRSRRLAKQIAAAFAVGMFAFMPVQDASAQNIEKADGTTFNGQVENIYADQRINDTAVSVYNHFELDAGNIANLHFGLNGATDADHLMNFVKDNVNINGVLNGVRNGSISGEMMFISPNGIAVGTEGVINAGSFRGYVPESGTFDKMLEDNKVRVNYFEDKNPANLPQMVAKGIVPLNNAGTIVIQGKINTTRGADLYAGSVELKDLGRIESHETVNYASFVNTGSTNAGLSSGNLTTTTNEAGDIVIKAYQTDENWRQEDDDPTKYPGIAELHSKLTMGEHAAVISENGGVTLAAETQSSNLLGNPRLTADAAINGTVTGKTVDIHAKVTDTYAVAMGDGLANYVKSLGDKEDFTSMVFEVLSTTENVRFAFSNQEAAATVNIGSTARITATGTDGTRKDAYGTDIPDPALKINASSTMKGTISTLPQTTLGWITDLFLQRFRDVTYVNLGGAIDVDVNKATVNVAGGSKIVSEKGGAEVKAGADYTVKMDAFNKAGGKDSIPTNLAFGFMKVKNNSDVKVEQGAEIEANGGNADVLSQTTNDITFKVKASNSVRGKARAGSSVGIMLNETGADTTINGSIKGSNVKADARILNYMESVSIENKVGKDNTMDSILILKTDTYYRNLVRHAFDSVFGEVKKDDSSLRDWLEKTDASIAAGASAGYIRTDNNANVNIGKTAVLDAFGRGTGLGKLQLSSYVDEEYLSVSASGDTVIAPGKGTERGEQPDTKVNAAILINNINNKASVKIEDGTEAQHAKLSGQDISLTADDKLFDNITVMKAAVAKAASEFKSNVSGLPADAAKLMIEALTLCGKAFEPFDGEEQSTQDYVDALKNVHAQLVKVQETWNKLVKDYGNTMKVIKNPIGFLVPEAYANYHVSPGISDIGELDDKTPWGVTGAVNVNQITDSANTDIGKKYGAQCGQESRGCNNCRAS